MSIIFIVFVIFFLGHFVEALRQLQLLVKKENFCLIHVSMVPIMGDSGEQKTKPTQHRYFLFLFSFLFLFLFLCFYRIILFILFYFVFSFYHEIISSYALMHFLHSLCFF